MSLASTPGNSLIRLHATSRHLVATRGYPTVHPTSPSISTSKMTPPSNHRAPWRSILDAHLEQTPGYEFTIATVGQDAHGRTVPLRAALLLGAAQLAGSQLATGKSTDCPGCLGCNMIYQQDIRSHAGIRAWSGIRTRLIVFNGL